MIYKYRPLSTPSSTRDDKTVPLEQSGEKLQSTQEPMKRKEEKSDSSDSSNYSLYLYHTR